MLQSAACRFDGRPKKGRQAACRVPGLIEDSSSFKKAPLEMFFGC